MLTETELETIASKLARRMTGREYGSIRVEKAAGEVITDVDGYLAVQLDVQLNDPAGETWPPDDIADLHRGAQAEAHTFHQVFPVYLDLRPRTEPDQESEPDDES